MTLMGVLWLKRHSVAFVSVTWPSQASSSLKMAFYDYSLHSCGLKMIFYDHLLPRQANGRVKPSWVELGSCQNIS